MEFHLSRSLRDQFRLEDPLFSNTGKVVFDNLAAARQIAKKINDVRKAASPSEPMDADAFVHASQLFAMGLINELSHAVLDRYRRERDPQVLAEALRWFAAREGSAGLDALLVAFVSEFPSHDVYRGVLEPRQWLARSTGDLSNREAALEELLLLWLANNNPAFTRFRQLFDDKVLAQSRGYQEFTAHLEEYFETRPEFSPKVKSVLAALRAPVLAAPDSLSGQLDFIRENWEPQLGPRLSATLLAIDVLREEEVAIWMQFHPPTGPYRDPQEAQGWSAEGFQGDEYVGFDAYYGEVTGPDGVRRRILRGGTQYASDYQAPLDEFEAFSSDQAWMPTVVLIAKSTYVWLEQLSRKYLRHIHRLDQIPLEELQLLASRGMTGLWLIGLWERSKASQTIKRLRGQADAVASAYSLMDYHIAEDLGGDTAYQVLRDQAASVGLRLASDMVPNHMGIDSTWVIEHPEWFLRRNQSPFPVYQFEGPDLSTDPRVEIKIEDHYYDQTDAAVAFRLRHRGGDGRTEYIYHGNDGTTFAWNDTAQLDYSQAAVREHVIQVILQVARQFPIIRFDAAMVLAKRHVQRLWFPLPGVGGSIPSRAEDAMSQEDFDRMMPNEFWREVVDRVAAEVPGTLLLAEAFWLLEGYFVRTLGMHRVYNSAFMVMLRDEENAKFRSYLKKTIEFDPDILKRYVNFMSNPDERTAIDQFGTGDKFFGVSTMMATIPGLPMFAHGQVEGFTERYGMEFKQARMEEWPNEHLIARHQQEIAPLLQRRALFAESENFVMYDFWTPRGTVDENVFAYTNRLGSERAIVLYNNTYGSTSGTIHLSAADMDKQTGQLRQRRLKDALALPHESHDVIAYRDKARNLEYLRRATDFDHHGLTVDLRGYQYMVLLDWRMLRSTAEQPWDVLCDALSGSGVYNLNDAISQLRVRPLSEAIRRATGPESVRTFASVSVDPSKASPEDILIPFLDRAAPVFDRWRELEGSTSAIAGTAQQYRTRLSTLLAAAVLVLADPPTKPEHSFQHQKQGLETQPPETLTPDTSSPDAITADTRSAESKQPERPEQRWTPLLAWAVLRALPPAAETSATPRSPRPEGLFDRLSLRPALAEIFTQAGIDGEEAWRTAARIRVLLGGAALRPDNTQASTAFWNDPDVSWLSGLNEYHGVRYLDGDKLAHFLRALEREDEIEFAAGLRQTPAIPAADVLARVEAMEYSLDSLLEALAHPPALAKTPVTVKLPSPPLAVEPTITPLATPLDSFETSSKGPSQTALLSPSSVAQSAEPMVLKSNISSAAASFADNSDSGMPTSAQPPPQTEKHRTDALEIGAKPQIAEKQLPRMSVRRIGDEPDKPVK